MENYICINGKKAELTKEQLKALGIELPKTSPFERVCNHANDFYSYYFITSMGTVNEAIDRGFENGHGNDDLRHRTGNYCTSLEIMNQRALYEILNRLLWRYSMEHDGDKIDWSNPAQDKWYMFFNHEDMLLDCDCCNYVQRPGVTYFHTSRIAISAITEVVEPFMKAHPDFKW